MLYILALIITIAIPAIVVIDFLVEIACAYFTQTPIRFNRATVAGDRLVLATAVWAVAASYVVVFVSC